MGSKFLIKYIFYIVILFGVFYLDFSPIANLINSFQIDLISNFLSLFLDNIDGRDIIISSHYKLVIERDCNGLMVYYIFLATILASNVEWRYKILWVFIGYVVISAVNIFRIFIITNLVLESRSNFHLAHDIFGNILLFITAISLFLIFIKLVRE